MLTVRLTPRVAEWADDQPRAKLSRISFPASNHQSRRLVVSPVRAQLPRCGGSARPARCHGYLRDDSAVVLRLCRGTGNERRGGAVESHAQGASDPRAHLPEPQGGTRRSDRVRGAVQHDLAAREARVSHADRGPARRTSYAGRRSVNLCPKNWVRYTSCCPPTGRSVISSASQWMCPDTRRSSGPPWTTTMQGRRMCSCAVGRSGPSRPSCWGRGPRVISASR